MIQPFFTSFQEQIRDEQEQYRELIKREQAQQYVERVQQMRSEILSRPQTQGGPETNGASRNQQRRGRGRGRGRSRGVQGRGRQGHQSN